MDDVFIRNIVPLEMVPPGAWIANILINRQWHNVLSDRKSGTWYRNDPGYPIEVAVSTGPAGSTYNFAI
jgi:hypothetical protein